ncbi:lysophospholipase [Trichodelitschia bisporula]|uniref:Lysophospholipase n=1 Tax=Trichodelitschia bisporula TaxID=703511 RepID=A0A6G1HRV8_9PEZI|nr:lysophospholipase [Trichodelitschia bisporula]
MHILSLALLAGATAHAAIDPAAFDPATHNETSLAILEETSLARRASSISAYSPVDNSCPPTRPSIRAAHALSNREKDWLTLRRSTARPAMRELLTRIGIADFDAGAWMDKHANDMPVVGIAFSGGGYRALLNGAGALAAFDSRTPGSTGKGHVGGVLQASTYVAGLSGGSWLVGSIYVNNFSSVSDIISTAPDKSSTGNLWQFQNPIFTGPSNSLLSKADYYMTIFNQVRDKVKAGFDSSITDYWGRALSFQLINAPAGAPGYTWSSLADSGPFSRGDAPMPLIVADGRAPGEIVISLNATVFEFTPFEMGSHDPTLFGFAPMKYVGSNFTAGSLPSSEACVTGFDNAGYVMGTSSSLFNQFLLQLDAVPGVPQFLRDALNSVLGKLDKNQNDIADWTPNPFLGWNKAKNPGANSRQLTLVDGGEDLQNIPLHPLIQPIRGVDVIFAVDSSADTLNRGANWPNGTALVATYMRSLSPEMQNGTAFPSIPDQATFVNLGLNSRPTFFGCNSSNNTGPTPLLVYLPNTPYSYMSNVSTFDPKYNISERNAMIENGYNVASMGNGTVDDQWPTCLACAMLSRSLERTKTAVPKACTACFKEYCWNGTRNSKDVQYEPSLLLQDGKAKTTKKKGAAARGVGVSWAVLGAALAVSVCML